VDKGASLRVCADKGGIPERAAEVDGAKLIRVNVSVHALIRASAVKSIAEELAVLDIAEVTEDQAVAIIGERTEPC
jgi:hypothetical protein